MAAAGQQLPKKLMIAGLGNLSMMGTRHSVGMAFIDKMAHQLNLKWERIYSVKGYIAEHIFNKPTGCSNSISPSDTKQNCSTRSPTSTESKTKPESSLIQSCTASEPGCHLILLKPTLLMNINGKSVAKAAKHFGLAPEEIILLHDELDRQFGKVSKKEGGSANGHRGVQSVIDTMKTNQIPRIRIGISRPPDPQLEVADYVLQDFNESETLKLDEVYQQTLSILAKHFQQHCLPDLPIFTNTRTKA